MGIINRMNKINARDLFVKVWSTAIQICLDQQAKQIEQYSRDIYFDECSEGTLAIYEREAGISSGGLSIEDRRATLQARWLASNVPSLTMVQRIADSWKFGKTECTYDNLTITVKFTDKGVPTGLDELKAAIAEAVPAHLAINYVYSFNTWKDIAGRSWGEASKLTWEEIRTR